MKKIYLFAILGLFISSSVSADVTQFVFTTSPQHIAPDTLSDTLTVQSQNSSGAQENIAETMDITFTSTSQTGSFYSTTGNPVSTTMSKNTANKNFLYKDSTSGTHTITVKAVGRTSQQSFSTTQDITIGNIDENATSTPGDNSNPDSSIPVPTPIPAPTPVTIYSAHSSPSPLSNDENKIEFEVYAGRDRLTTVGNLINFKASPVKLLNVYSQGITFKWSFGDGSEGSGSNVAHAYKFPGEYSVVLNATYSDQEAVSRLQVKVVDPVITIDKVQGGIEVTNNSKNEINLEGWSLVSGSINFIFPKDTLVGAGKKITVPDDLTKITNTDLSLRNPLGKEFATNAINIGINSTVTKSDDAKNKATYLPVVSKPKLAVVTVNTNNDSQIESTTTNIANVIFTAKKQPGFFSNIFNFVKHIFTEN